jgi:methionyl-tRNA formyltransferase
MATAVVFAYHNVGVRCLSVLLARGVDVLCVFTHEDDPREQIWFDSVASLCQRQQLRVRTDNPNDPAVVAELQALQPDFIFSFYYRHMLKADVLSTAKRGAYNMHGSLLPKYRGRVPVNWAVIHGETETGATLHAMEVKPDAGAIAAQQAVPILPDDTAFEVFQKVTVAAELALYQALPGLIDGTLQMQPQNLTAGSYFSGRKPEDGRIDWRLSARQIHNLIRAVAPPYPGAFFDLDGHRLRVLRSRCRVGGQARHTEPGLYWNGDHLAADLTDASTLALLEVELDGQRLTESLWRQIVRGQLAPLPACLPDLT